MKPDELIQGERRSAETMSETSEGTATTSLSGQQGFESREELLELAAVLRLNSLEELHRDRFRVDRRKLEHMLLGDDEAPEPAETFFHKIMDETNTFITWPSRLKIGAKSKKDPHIKVAGRVDDVRAAKEKIMQILDTRQSMRVTMKLDVSYTDHSHIIGKGGLTIKRVMEETACHIHFPDSNRSNHQEKSNQVSIAGEIEGVEKARARVRNLTPLIFSFELPIMGAMQSPPDSTSPYIVQIQEKYNVQVMFRTRPKLHATLVVVKGCEWEVLQVKEATVFLIHHMCKNLANQIQVQMSMEISPQHHSIVLGKQSSNLKLIMNRTSTQIIFPDAGDPNIPSLKKSNVIITGAINNVYLARQQLVGSLPLVLMFDLPDNSPHPIDTETISQLMQSLDVFINVRHKPKQSSLSVIIKGVERNANSIYEARRQLLTLDDSTTAEIPITYQIPNAGSVFTPQIPDNFPNILTVNPPFLSSLPNSPNPMNLSPHWSLPPVQSMFSPIIHHPFAFPNANAQLLAATRHAMQTNILNQQQNVQSHPPGFAPNYYGNFGEKETSNYLSLSSASSSLSSPAVSPRNVSPIGNDVTSDFSGIFNDLSVQEEKRKFSHFSGYDYDQKKIMAMKAMKSKLKGGEYRVPTPTWSGYGLSQTMPGKSESEKKEPKDLWDPETPLLYVGGVGFEGEEEREVGMASGYLEGMPRGRLEKIVAGNHTDLTAALVNGGIDKKWIDTLTSHEIDMSTFISLTEKDLVEIGVSAWGARRKMMVLIAELKQRTKPFSGSAAPGAERRASLTIPSVPTVTSVDGKW